ncbi:M17 family peptidase N-terminal domain-containing protein [Edaphobacter aggregans]|uniref:M17 family peptidase N-terminal domain-containing protein n=1 Tax=Edaphobacter aggregans TaxID=570835 RepID=UPI00055749CC|nr:M17 family peptidase N-terminal domain-containing protein [Edaphobacter aggregans]
MALTWRDSGRLIVEVRRLVVSALLCCSVATHRTSAQTSAASLPVAGQVRTVQSATFPVDVLVQGPAETMTELQVICLFRSEPSDPLHGSLVEMNERLQGLLDAVRKPSLFSGEAGETLLVIPRAGTIPAQRLLIVGLGDPRTFTPARMNLVGAIVFEEAHRMVIHHPFFAPMVLDGGVSEFSTGEIASEFMSGFLRARRTQALLADRYDALRTRVEKLTFLADAAHAADTQEGLAKALAAEAK